MQQHNYRPSCIEVDGHMVSNHPWIQSSPHPTTGPASSWTLAGYSVKSQIASPLGHPPVLPNQSTE